MLGPDAKREPAKGSRSDLSRQGSTDANCSPEVIAVATTPVGMTKGERDQLVKLANLRARIAKANVGAREAELRADVESQLAATYQANHEAWAVITARAAAAVNAADEEIALLCREMGVSDEFRPSLHCGWHSRGENAENGRRSELRKVAQTAIEAAGKQAKLAIDTRTAEVLTELIAGSLESAEARAFLESIPTPEQLMPSVNIEALALGNGHR